MNEELDYLSSQPSPIVDVDEETKTTQDDIDISTLSKVDEMFDDYIDFYEKIDSIDIKDKTVSVENKMIANKIVLEALRSIKFQIDTAIKKSKEKYK